MAAVSRSTKVVTPLGVLLLALIFLRLSLVQTILLSPAFLATTVLAVCAIAVALSTRREQLNGIEPHIQRQRHALRRLAFTTPSAWSAVQTRQTWEEQPSPSWRIPIRHMTSAALSGRIHSFFDLTKTHFILPWHERISPSPAFPNAVETLIRQSLSKVVERGEKTDWPDTFVARIAPRVTEHLHHFRSIEHLSSTSTTPTTQTTLPLPLPHHAHPALTSAAHAQGAGLSPNIEAHLRGLVKRMLAHILPEQERTRVVDAIVTEVVLGSILLPVFEMLCDGDFWNRQIDDRGGRYLREQKQVNKFLSALSTLQQPLVTPSPTRSTASPVARKLPPASSVSVHSSSKHFDAFLRSIAKLKTLGEARRLKADVERELRNLSLEPMDKGDERAERKRKRYQQRLEKARAQIDDRITVLSGPSPASLLMSTRPSGDIVSVTPEARVELYAVLADPSSLAYFLEFMERRSRSRLVQFWLTIEGFKDPLEAAGKDSAVEITGQPTQDETKVSDNTTMAEDVSFLYLAYISQEEGALSLQISSRHKAVIQNFAENLSPGQALTTGEVRRTKHAMFSAQKAVYDQMREDDWPAFMRSELYIKAKVNLESAFARPSVSSTTPFVVEKSPKVTSAPTPPTPHRQQTAPAGPLQSPRLASPPSRPLPRLVNGSFAPTPTTPEPTISVGEPLFRRVPSDGPPSTGAPTRQGSRDLLGAASPPGKPSITRGTSHFDVLMSHDEPKERGPLFDDDRDDDVEDDEDFVQVQRMEAIQAALNDIIASDDLTASRMSDHKVRAPAPPAPEFVTSPSASMVSLPALQSRQHERTASRSVEDLRKASASPRFISAPHSRHTSGKGGDLPTLAERKSFTGLSPTHERPSRHLFNEEEQAFEGSGPDVDDQDEQDRDTPDDIVKLAEPGNLYLGVEISRLQERLQELVKQEHLLETLIRQAELTGNQAELRILNRSISLVRRDTRTCIFQKAQYEQQEEENRLDSSKTRITIPRHIDTEVDGKQVVRYVVRIEQLGDDHKPMLHWDVLRRYNEFHDFDQNVREWAAANLDKSLYQNLRKQLPDLPGKKIAPVLSTSQLDSRRSGLERYMQALLAQSSVCDSVHVRAFLSRNTGHANHAATDATASIANLSSLAPHNLVRSLYKTMATSLDDAMFGPSMLDLMYTSLSRQISDVTGLVGMGSEELAGMLPQALKAGWANSAALGSSPSAVQMGAVGGPETAVSAFTAPICDLCIELFDLKENKNNWLRRQAIVVIIQQFLGSTIERKVRDSFRNAHQPDAIEKVLAGLQDMLFPDGQRRPPSDPRTAQEKHETKIRASKKLGMLIPDVAANMIGRSNARRAARRVFAALQDTRLNQQLILCILDEIFDVLFPAAK